METKICNKCNEEKELIVENFYWRKDSKKFRNTCMICHKEARKQYRKDRGPNNSLEHKESAKKYRNNHKEYYKEYGKKYRDDNKENIQEKRDANKAKRNARAKERYKNDPDFKLRGIVSRQINKVLKLNSGSKNGKSCFEYLPYTEKELRLHITSQFEDWMNWSNHGVYNVKTWIDNKPSTHTWNLDHIIPKSDLPHETMDEENFQKCWGLSNLRPLSAKQNILDGANKTRHLKKKD